MKSERLLGSPSWMGFEIIDDRADRQRASHWATLGPHSQEPDINYEVVQYNINYKVLQ